MLGARVGKIEVQGRQVRTLGGRVCPYGALLLATGSDPIRLPIPTHNLRHVHYLRTLAVPFFWSSHYDVTISYAGHAERWDRIDLSGSLAAADCTLAFRALAPGQGERTYAVATLGRGRESLRAEAALERLDWAALDSWVPAARRAQHA